MADRSRGLRQRKHWHAVGDVIVSMTTTATAILGSFTASGAEPFTVLRMTGAVAAAPRGAAVDLEAAAITLGVGIVSSDALAVGATAMPDPAGEPDYPWLWWYPMLLLSGNASDTVGAYPRGWNINVESKAMRKVGPRQSLVLLAEYVGLTGTSDYDVVGSIRFLVGTS